MGKRLFLSLGLAVCLSAAPTLTCAQPVGGEEKAELSGTRKQLATIVFAGLAGTILGLSTLSFYGRPQEHFANLAYGFAFGIIGGTIFTTYKAATSPYEAYDVSAITPDRFAPQPTELRPMMSYQWKF